ncbi:MAG: hypothetical protein ABJ387_03540 [Balneola sp.]
MASDVKNKLIKLLSKKIDSESIDFDPEEFVKISTWIQIATAQELVDANVSELIQEFEFTHNNQDYEAVVRIDVFAIQKS